MELWELSILIIIVGAISLIAIRMFRAPVIVKEHQKASKEMGIKEAHSTEKRVFQDTIDSLKKHNRSLQNTLNKKRGLEQEEYEPDEDAPIPMEILKIAAQKMGLNPEALNNPDTVKWIQEQLRSPEAKQMIREYVKNSANQPKDPYDSIPGV